MVKSKITLFICLFCAFAVSQAYSAPSVKKLGGMNSVAGIGGVASVKSDALNNVRSASVRAVKPLNNAKPVITTKANNSGSAIDNVNTARLSVGKYLHNAGQNAGIIKPVSGSTVNPAAAETVEELTGRVEVLEGKIETKAESGDYYTKQEIDDKNYVTKSELEEADYVTTTDLNTVSNAASALSTSLSTLWGRVSRVEDALGAGEHLAKDWETQGLVFE